MVTSLAAGRTSSPSFFANGSTNGRCVPGQPNSSLLCSTSSCDLPWAFHFLRLPRECAIAPMTPAQGDRASMSRVARRRRTAVSMLGTA